MSSGAGTADDGVGRCGAEAEVEDGNWVAEGINGGVSGMGGRGDFRAMRLGRAVD